MADIQCASPRPGLFIMAITLNSVILSKALAFAFPTRFFCGSGERGVEGSAVSSATMPILTDHRSLDSARAAHPGKSRRDAVLLRASLRRKSFTTETRRTRSFGFYRVFSVISVPPWWIFIPRGGPKVHTTLPMNKPMLAPEEQRVHSRTPWLGGAGGFPCACGGAALLAQRCSRCRARPCSADETECEPVCEPWR